MVRIELVNHSDNIESLLELHRNAFGLLISEEYWKWKFMDNPLAQDIENVVVAIENGKIVGARPFMFGEMWLKDKKVRVAQHCDTMVHPHHQRKGIFYKMGKFALELLQKQGIAFSYGFPNMLSRGGFIKQGYKRVTDTMADFLVINSNKLISTKIENWVLASGASFIFNIFFNRKKQTELSDENFFEFEVLDRIDNRPTNIESLRSNSVVDLVRSEDFLRWRFDAHPNFDYSYILARKNGELWGYAVISFQKDSDGVFFGRIVDHVVRDSDFECYKYLMNKCFVELEKRRCDCYLIFTIGEPKLKETLLKDFGFKSFGKFPYNRLLDDGYLDAIQINEDFCFPVDIYNKNNWRVTYAFYDQT